MLALSNFGLRLSGGICSSPVAALQTYNSSDRSISPASSETSTSSSSVSVFSVEAASSQSSESSVDSIHVAWAGEEPWQTRSRREETQESVSKIVPPTNNALPTRTHPRRSSISLAQRPPPALLRQSEKKGQFVDNLVDSATLMVEVIWPLSVPVCPRDATSGQGVLPLRTFIQETLRRSRTSFSTLQVALYYLLLIKSHVPKFDFTMEQPEDCPAVRALQCGRRMFLAALILASKYLQDRNYSARAWSKISGLNVCEINNNEMAFLEAVGWKLHIKERIFDRWQAILIKYTSPSLSSYWKKAVLALSPQLDNLPCLVLDWSERTVAAHPVPRVPMPQFSSPAIYTPPSPTGSVPPTVLEPVPTMLPPPPALGRMKPLPTPALTPQTSVTNTPAMGIATPCPRQNAMCAAMAMAQNVSMQRTVMDCNIQSRSLGLEAYHMSRRRPSAVSAAESLASSPESMISDSTSHWSRSSSISSASSISPPNAGSNCLARLAALRRAGLPPQQEVPRKENDQVVVITSLPLTVDPMSSPEIDRMQVAEPDGSSDVLFDSQKMSSTSWWQPDQAGNRKRGRSSIDMSLQQHVRSLLKADLSPREVGRPSIAEYEMTGKSPCLGKDSFISKFGSDLPDKEVQSLSLSGVETRLPVQKQLGRKRACCASIEAPMPNHIIRFEGGPGMWEGIL